MKTKKTEGIVLDLFLLFDRLGIRNDIAWTRRNSRYMMVDRDKIHVYAMKHTSEWFRRACDHRRDLFTLLWKLGIAE
jgi:hypothetical protein